MRRDTDRLFVRDLVLDCSIGVHAREHDRRQPVRINLDLEVVRRDGDALDRIEDVVCYETLTNTVRAIVEDGHITLVETLAERIAQACLADRRVRLARVRVEKLRVFADAASAGVVIVRRRRDEE